MASSTSLTTTGLKFWCCWKCQGEASSELAVRPQKRAATEQRMGYVGAGLAFAATDEIPQQHRKQRKDRTRRIIASFPEFFERDVEDRIFLPTVVNRSATFGFIHGEPSLPWLPAANLLARAIQPCRLVSGKARSENSSYSLGILTSFPVASRIGSDPRAAPIMTGNLSADSPRFDLAFRVGRRIPKQLVTDHGDSHQRSSRP